jgi:hypothetical protein
VQDDKAPKASPELASPMPAPAPMKAEPTQSLANPVVPQPLRAAPVQDDKAPKASPELASPMPVPAPMKAEPTQSLANPVVPQLPRVTEPSQEIEVTKKSNAVKKPEEIPPVLNKLNFKESKIKNTQQSKTDSSLAVIPVQNFVRPKDIATGAVASFYESEDETIASHEIKPSVKIHLVSAAPEDKHEHSQKTQDHNIQVQGWQDRLLNAKTSVEHYFDVMKYKIINALNQ